MPGQTRGYFPGGVPPVSGAAPADTPDHDGAAHAPWGSIRAQWEAENRRAALAELAKQNPQRYGGSEPHRDHVNVWETDGDGIDRLVRVERAQRPRRPIRPHGEDETYAEILQDLDPRRGPASGFL